MHCVFTLLWGVKSVYAQNATVPVTIILEEPSGTALPTPVVNRTDLTVKLGGSGETFTVSLSSPPLEETTVSWGLNDGDLPPGGERDDLDLSLESFIFTSENWDEGQPVTVTANTDAETEEYLITFEITGNSGGGGVGSTLPEVTVTVEDWLEINFSSPSVHARRRYVRIPVDLTVEEGFTASVEVTLSLPDNSPDFLQVHNSAGQIRFTEHNYETSQDVIVYIRPSTDEMVGEYGFILTASRVGYNNIQVEGTFRIIPNPCQFNIRIMESELDFGTWNGPGEEGLEGSITINSTTGSDDGGINMTLVGEGPTAAKFELTTQNCRLCTYGIDSWRDEDELRGQNGDHTIDFTMEYSKWNDDRITRDRALETTGGLMGRPDRFVHTLQFGGTISGITSNTRPDTYLGTIVFGFTCGV